ncbi:restriction endonuclease subunit S [Flavobacterium sp.]|uniref:restriction endonuclease subunit S n=1 Tax=Flavobacterium sp. TaxID=239 RepID=UPI000EE1B33B|nr:restriction endonuclease subunit S [Flavobacterium sp.]HCQ14491.1 restriction endonuclease subunit S [Flavobacterium sp.]
MKEVRLDEICIVIAGQSPPSDSYNQDKNGVPFFQGKADFGSMYPTVRYWCNKPTKISLPNDILFSVRAPVGPTNINNIEACIGRGLSALRCKEDVLEMKYLLHYLRANENKISDLGTGSTFKAITISELKKLQIPLPPLPQQKKIANILDAADALRQNDKALIAKYDELTQALFLDMFGDPVSNPKGWEKVETIKYCDSIVPGRDKPKSFTGSTPWVTTNDLNHLGKTSISKSNIGLSDNEILQVKAKIIPEGSVIMTCVGDLGVVTVNTSKMVVNQQLHAFICGPKLKNDFLMYSLSFQKPYMYKMSSSTTVPYMNKTVCNNTPTIVPPIELQNQFVERVAVIEEQKAIAQKSLEKSEELFNSLLQKAFKGEL